MSEFKKVSRAVYPPRKCAFCFSQEGPFVDTETDIDPFGRIYACIGNAKRAGCARMIGRLDAMCDTALFDASQKEVRELKAAVAELEGRTLEVVPLSEVREGLLAGVFTTEE